MPMRFRASKRVLHYKVHLQGLMAVLSEYFNRVSNFIPTQGQSYFFEVFERFWNSDKKNCCLLLNGYAGTGKTTVMRSVAAYVKSFNNAQLVMLAPTGKAAKVLSNYTNRKAFTIHKYIYALTESGGEKKFSRKENKHKNALFIVDEASMISGEVVPFSPQKQSLLHDLIDYVKQGDNCKLLMVGDEAQLPPVHSLKSPALDKDLLRDAFDLLVAKCSFDEVLRQEEDSGVLFNATNVRYKINDDKKSLKLYNDAEYFKIIDAYTFLEAYETALQNFGNEEVIVLTKSNKNAVLFNQQIRNRVLYLEESINGGDRLMVVKNNYYYAVPDAHIDFIANGEAITVNRVLRTEEKYGMLFADADIHLDYFETDIQVKLNLAALYSHQSAVELSIMEKMYDDIEAELIDDYPLKRDRKDKLKSNPYLGALQVKYAYAITGHKAQGGQWHSVFIDHGYITEDKADAAFYRWLYTAITRAKTQVYMLNPAGFLIG